MGDPYARNGAAWVKIKKRTEKEYKWAERRKKAGKQMLSEKSESPHLERNEFATSSKSADIRTDPFRANSKLLSVLQTVLTRALKRTSSWVRTVFMLSS